MKKAIGFAIVLAAIAAALIAVSLRKRADITVGSKHFTEQKILGEIVAQLIEAKTDLKVRRRLGLQGTKVCFAALEKGDLDIYPDYTGTGLVNILGHPYDPKQSREDVLEHVRGEFDRQWKIVWLDPLGFDNTYAFALRESHAEELGVTKISDLAKHKDTLRPGFDHEYTNRPEFKRFEKVYGFTFGRHITKLAPDLTYDALRAKKVDLIDAFATDWRIADYGLRVLEDDRDLFPPYDACVLVRRDTLAKYPELEAVLRELSGTITSDTMRDMNRAVIGQMRSPAAVAEEFLKSQGLIP